MLFFFLTLLINPQYKLEIGSATIYFPGDGHCSGLKANGKIFKKDDHHIAHRSLPLGTSGLLCSMRSKKCVTTTIEDRGPFGAIKSCHKGKPLPYFHNGKLFESKKIYRKGKCFYYQIRPNSLDSDYTYLNKFDLTIPIARSISHKPFDIVIFIYNSNQGNPVS